MKRLARVVPLLLVVFPGCFRDPDPVRSHDLAVREDQVEEVGIVEGVGGHGWAVPEERFRADLEGSQDPVPPPCGDDVVADCVAPALDVDNDGAPAEIDCDDLDPAISPFVPEVRCNGGDENCNGVDDCDRDGDGFRDVDDPEPDVPAESPAGLSDPPRWP